MRDEELIFNDRKNGGEDGSYAEVHEPDEPEKNKKEKSLPFQAVVGFHGFNVRLPAQKINEILR